MRTQIRIPEMTRRAPPWPWSGNKLTNWWPGCTMISAGKRTNDRSRAQHDSGETAMTKWRGMHLGIALLALGLAPDLWAQNPPTWAAESNPSPTAGSGVSKRANDAADKSLDKGVE